MNELCIKFIPLMPWNELCIIIIICSWLEFRHIFFSYILSPLKRFPVQGESGNYTWRAAFFFCSLTLWLRRWNYTLQTKPENFVLQNLDNYLTFLSVLTPSPTILFNFNFLCSTHGQTPKCNFEEVPDHILIFD